MRPFKPSFILEVIPLLLPFLGVTIAVTLSSVAFGSLLGLVLARAKVRGNRFTKLLADGYTWILRCSPSIVLLFMTYYGLPKMLKDGFGININGQSKGVFVVITFSLIFAATMSEVMRSAYESIDKGQTEAAVSVGMSPFQAFYRIVLPQAAVVAIPNFTNSLIGLLKEGSLAYTIGLIDIMGKGTLVISRNYGAYALETYIALGIIFWCLTLVIEKVFLLLELHFDKGRKQVLSV